LNRLESLRYRLLVVEALRNAKSKFSYRELSEATGVDATLLARYVGGSILPSYEHALKIWRGIKKLINPGKVILDVAKKYGGLIDLTPITTDPLMLRIISLEFLDRFKDEKITKILVPETSGISLATAMALHFNVPLVIARRRKENPLEEYIEGHIIESPMISRIFYVPKKNINDKDRILIVDDIIQTGLTLAVMEDIVRKAKAKVVGVAALVVVGEEWKKKLNVRRIEPILAISGHPL
jgi:adenine/guanine phosphoribosyltransferase-like PRPP-binding protein